MNKLQPHSDPHAQKKNVTQQQADYRSNNGYHHLWTYFKVIHQWELSQKSTTKPMAFCKALTGICVKKYFCMRCQHQEWWNCDYDIS